MKIEEAIEMLKQWNEDLSEFQDEKEGIECHDLAISALEKQIPKKINAENIKTSEQVIRLRHCPYCNVRFVRFGMNYCPDCGQALDWSDKE